MLTLYLSDGLGEFDRVDMEHSLLALSEWEARHEKAFMTDTPKTIEESNDYILCMIIGDPPDNFFERLTNDQINQINEYMQSKQSATWFTETQNNKKSSEVTTSELIYYWLVQFRIPFEVETWHLNRLLTLIQIAGIKQTPPKKMSKQAQMEEYRRLNAQRRQQSGSAG